MSNSSSSTNRSGIGFLGLLTILFIGLKLTGYIAWSWFWVLSPILIPLGLGLSIMVVCLAIFFFAGLFGKQKPKLTFRVMKS